MLSFVVLVLMLTTPQARADGTPETDIGWANYCIYPKNGAKLGLVTDRAYDTIDADYLKSVPLSENSICTKDVPADSTIVYQNKQGKLLKMHVLTSAYLKLKSGRVAVARIHMEGFALLSGDDSAPLMKQKSGGAKEVNFNGPTTTKGTVSFSGGSAGGTDGGSPGNVDFLHPSKSAQIAKPTQKPAASKSSTTNDESRIVK